MEKTTLKPYPWADETTGTKTRFATIETITDSDGKQRQVQVLKPVQPEIPVSEFVYDAASGTGRFVYVKDEKGNTKIVKGKPLVPYIPGEELKDLIKLAQILKRPILIKGEPGSGKTQFARSVAFEWYGNDYKNHFFEWPVKSTSKAVDGLYTFDHIARLREANLARNISAGTQVAEDLKQYRKFGPMGLAFLTSTEEEPSILLIDEIDKADIDFPNDLLLELDERRFSIPASETGELIEARYPPVIFITSNDERELPEAFLRRCLFLYIKFPGDEDLVRILQAHIPGFVEQHEQFVRDAIARFNVLRADIRENPLDNKQISTSELIDWLSALYHDIADGMSTDSIDLAKLPHAPSLLKSVQAVNRQEANKKNQK
ncbi:MAG: MoxR family ATPase [Flavitalea sp.]